MPTYPSSPLHFVQAPEIHELPGQTPPVYNAYFVAKTKADGILAVGVAHASSPTGPFTATDAPLVFDKIGAIDPTFYSENGTHYVVWKTDGNSQLKPCNIRIQQLTSDGLALAPGSSFATLMTNDKPWEGAVVEAPWIVKRLGVYYLFYSGMGYADSQ
jgi:arabinan endo-1,5-alpha-L-arabinosidase